MNVAILGASPKPERFAYKALKMLLEYSHKVYLVNPNAQVETIEGHPVYKSMADIPDPIDTLTLYVGPAISTTLEKEIIALKPRRVVFNPGSENTILAKALLEAKIKVIENCTLVMLRSDNW